MSKDSESGSGISVQAVVACVGAVATIVQSFKQSSNNNGSNDAEQQRQSEECIARINAQRDVLIELIKQGGKNRRAELKELFKSLNESIRANNMQMACALLDQIDRTSQRSIVQINERMNDPTPNQRFQLFGPK